MYYANGNNTSLYQNSPNSMNVPLNPVSVEKVYKGPFGLKLGVTIFLYLLFIFLFLIGAAGVAISISFYFLNYPSSDDSLYKFVGIGVGAFLMLVSLIIIIVLGCDHGFNGGIKRNNRVGPLQKLSHMSIMNTTNLNPGIYNINETQDQNYNYINQQQRNTTSRSKLNRTSSRRHRRDHDSSDDSDDYDRRKSSRLHSSYNQPIIQYQTPYSANYAYNPQPVIQTPIIIPTSAQPVHQDINYQTHERPSTTIIKEIHHHHYGPDNNTIRKSSSKQPSALLVRSSARSLSQIPINTTIVPTDEIETYQLNTNTGQLQLVNQLSVMPTNEQLVLIPQNNYRRNSVVYQPLNEYELQ